MTSRCVRVCAGGVTYYLSSLASIPAAGKTYLLACCRAVVLSCVLSYAVRSGRPRLVVRRCAAPPRRRCDCAACRSPARRGSGQARSRPFRTQAHTLRAHPARPPNQGPPNQFQHQMNSQVCVDQPSACPGRERTRSRSGSSASRYGKASLRSGRR